MSDGMLEHRWVDGVCSVCGRHREDEGVRGCNPTKEPAPAKPETCALCGNTREWHRNPGKSGVHRFMERIPPGAKERIEAFCAESDPDEIDGKGMAGGSSRAKPEAPKQDAPETPGTWEQLARLRATLATEKERAERAERALRGTESLRAKRAKDHARLDVARRTRMHVAESEVTRLKELVRDRQRLENEHDTIASEVCPRAKESNVDAVRRFVRDLADSRNDVTRLREVLEWYADEGNYVADDAGAALATAWQGGGIAIKAREALALKMFKDEQLRIAAGEEGGSDAAE